MIIRKSNSTYSRFIQALRDTGQEQIAVLLDGLEVKAMLNPHFLDNIYVTDRTRIVRLLRQGSVQFKSFIDTAT